MCGISGLANWADLAMLGRMNADYVCSGDRVFGKERVKVFDGGATLATIRIAESLRSGQQEPIANELEGCATPLVS